MLKNVIVEFKFVLRVGGLNECWLKNDCGRPIFSSSNFREN